MKEYLEIIQNVLDHGVLKENRTGVNTLYTFSQHTRFDISNSFPLLTTKDMGGGVWNSLIYELLWYLSGEHHIRKFEEHSKIWSSWADSERNLETAYGRYWRRFPVPDVVDRLAGEAWPDAKTMRKYVTEEPREGNRFSLTFDQIAYILDTLVHDPNSRRMVLTAWHPANAAVSRLPPCHYTATFSVNPVTDALNCHLTQRSGDLGLGVPFNWACYSALTYVLAKASGRSPGYFSHTIVDAHIYCGDGDEDPYSHVNALKEQLAREPRDLPTLSISGTVDPENPLQFLDNLRFEDFKLEGYNPHPRIKMKVAV